MKIGKGALVVILLAVVGVVALALAVMRSGPARDPVQQAAAEAVSRFLQHTGARDELGEAPGLALSRLALRGTSRLSDEQLTERAGLLGRILDGLDVRSCASQARGQTVSLTPGLRALDQPSLRRWFDLVTAAGTAEYRGAPPARPLPPLAELAEATRALLATLPAAEARRFQETADRLARSSDEDACWYLQTMVRRLPDLPPPQRATLARVLAAQ